MNSESDINEFNPSGVGLKNGNFIGLPFTEDTAKVILIPVPWDVTVSFGEGTALGPQAIRESSVQLDLYDPDVHDAWKLGIHMLPENDEMLKKRNQLRSKATSYIDFLERGGDLARNTSMKNILDEVNSGCQEMNDYVYQQSMKVLSSGKTAAVTGGDHSVPLGLLKALDENYKGYGILHIDAHLDLRKSYEGFTWSHASILHNILNDTSVSRLVQVAVRDYCDEEIKAAEMHGNRIAIFYDQQLKENKFRGVNWEVQCLKIVDLLPQQVYITLDMDGFDPKLCPHTGTPVPGGLDFFEVVYLFKKLVESGRRIIGFDVCETGNHPWDSNVGARIIYKLCNLTGRSQQLI